VRPSGIYPSRFVHRAWKWVWTRAMRREGKRGIEKESAGTIHATKERDTGTDMTVTLTEKDISEFNKKVAGFNAIFEMAEKIDQSKLDKHVDI